METSTSTDSMLMPVIIAVLGSNVVTTILSSFFSRKKNKAEVNSIESSSEASLHKTILDYADGMREDIQHLKGDLVKVNEAHEELRKEYEELFTKLGKVEAEKEKYRNQLIELRKKLKK